ncbi:serine hydrolase [Altererythrobacter luteolus]|uniref:Serine hydrolase n=1 Tax=Pontixanthobacter luteolus TaxID=295089 RepID=A0A6I4UZR9_9SPHN|nr:serine hydrolase [Pontixanthobacter luteolus]MXP46276.1 serine hydrolase [Pontixanthobacter luteolus]
MIRQTLAASVLLIAASPAAAQSQQEALDARYDRALAAGYKALFLCGAIANADRVGQDRLAEHVEQWELTGIQAPLDDIIRTLPHEIVTDPNGVVDHVTVTWADDMPPRVAEYRGRAGCAIMPPGTVPETDSNSFPKYGDALIRNWHTRIDTPVRSRLEAAFTDDYGKGARTTSVIIDQGGQVVDEMSAEGFGPFMPQRTWSVAKSIAATLVGMAVQRGEADVHASAGLGAGEGDPRATITIDHLLRMASGRYSDTAGNRTDPIYFGGATVDERAANWPLMYKPGTAYRYANNDTLMAVAAIKSSLAAPSVTEQLWDIGMTNTTAEADWQGNFILSSQVWASPFDLVELGRLYLNDGMRGNSRVLPEGWRDYVSAPSGPQPEGRAFGYGAGFWLFNNSPGVPADTFAAMGNRGQYVVIVPSRDVVIVRRGEDPVGSRFDIAAFTRDVLADLD